jgi:hypothetical protein
LSAVASGVAGDGGAGSGADSILLRFAGGGGVAPDRANLPNCVSVSPSAGKSLCIEAFSARDEEPRAPPSPEVAN